MGNESQRFFKHLADKIAQKDAEPYHLVITWLRTQISFELLRLPDTFESRFLAKKKIEAKLNISSLASFLKKYIKIL